LAKRGNSSTTIEIKTLSENKKAAIFQAQRSLVFVEAVALIKKSIFFEFLGEVILDFGRPNAFRDEHPFESQTDLSK
jgi:hypothetical protein